MIINFQVIGLYDGIVLCNFFHDLDPDRGPTGKNEQTWQI
jgi:hypothetical protein